MRYVVFSLSSKEYGIILDQVSEVVRMRKITPVPDTAEFVEGVIYLRGKVITLINMRKKMGFERGKSDKSDRIIISNVGDHVVGLLVDSVSGVVNFENADITKPDEALHGAGYLLGLARYDKVMVLLVDIYKLLSEETRESIKMIKSRVKIKGSQSG